MRSWSTGFGLFQYNPFLEEEDNFFTAHSGRGSFRLRLNKDHFFAWADAGEEVYRDFYLDATMVWEETSGKGASGFLLRHLNDENYYYFLVSRDGFFRFDVVFNGKPQSLIPWTACGFIEDRINRLTCLVRESEFQFFLNGHWIAECSDARVYSGKLAFAAQNYEGEMSAEYALESLKLEARPSVVESDYLSWENLLPPEREPLFQLALTCEALGQYREAVRLLTKAVRIGEPDDAEALFYGRCLAGMDADEQALVWLNRSLEMKRSPEALLEKASILWKMRNYRDLKLLIEESGELLGTNTAFLRLAGESRYVAGDFEGAAEYYSQAFSLSRIDDAEIAERAAYLYSRAGFPEKASDFYLKASRRLLMDNQMEALAPLLEQVEKVNPGSEEARILQIKLEFFRGDREKACIELHHQIEEGVEDSSLFFLLGMDSFERGDKEQALEYFDKAGQLDPTIGLYFFRKAEILFQWGRSPDEDLGKALALEPDDPWNNNLQGEILSLRGDFREALVFYRKALKTESLSSKERLPLLINTSSCLQSLGDDEAADALMDPYSQFPEIRNHQGNLLFARGRLTEALSAYEDAVRLSPENKIYRENAADLCIKLERFSRAEEFLGPLIDEDPSADVLTKMGVIASIKGDTIRADAAFKTALEIDSRHAEAKLNLADLYYARYNAVKAIEYLDSVDPDQLDPDLMRHWVGLRNRLKEKISCAVCGREWWIPRNLPPQKALRLCGEPPDEAPAGRSPATGKVYCIGCAREHLEDGRFLCPDSGQPLKIDRDALKYLLAIHVETLLDK